LIKNEAGKQALRHTAKMNTRMSVNECVCECECEYMYTAAQLNRFTIFVKLNWSDLLNQLVNLD